MIDKKYAYHKPSSRGLEAITRLREAYSTLQRTIEEVCPPSRQCALAITELEMSAMWAIKSVVFNDSESEVEQ